MMRRMRVKSWMKRLRTESEEHVSEEIAEREEDSEHRKEKRPKPAKATG
jgi:hypothetical protein